MPLLNTPTLLTRSEESLREAKPLFYNYFPLSFEGEGDKGGEVDKNTILFSLENGEILYSRQ